MRIFKKYPKYKWILGLFDLVLFLSSFAIALQILIWVKLTFGRNITEYSSLSGWAMYIPFVILALAYFQYANLYKIQNIIRPFSHWMLLLKSVFFIVMGFVLFQFIFKNFQIESRMFYIILFVTQAMMFVTLRIPFIKLIGGQSLVRDNVAILGAGEKGKALLRIFKNKMRLKNVIGYLDDNVDEPYIEDVPYLGTIKHAEAVAQKYNIDYFILAIDNITRKRFFEILKYFRQKDLGFCVSSDYLQILYDKLDIDIYDEFGIVRFGSGDSEKFMRVVKRLFDISLSTIGIFILSPVFLFIALMIAVDSKGPIIYTQIRIGKNGKPFYFYKFRSMALHSDKDEDRTKAVTDFIKGGTEVNGHFINGNGNGQENGNGATTKIVSKKNVTRVGKFIRKYSLDELTQLFNVLKGDMSLVGPRPCLVSEWKIYEEWQKLRLNSVPGCTGIWQVSGRSEVDFEESVLMDIYYNQNYTPLLDLQIIFKTIPVMVLGKGGE